MSWDFHHPIYFPVRADAPWADTRAVFPMSDEAVETLLRAVIKAMTALDPAIQDPIELREYRAARALMWIWLTGYPPDFAPWLTRPIWPLRDSEEGRNALMQHDSGEPRRGLAEAAAYPDNAIQRMVDRASEGFPAYVCGFIEAQFGPALFADLLPKGAPAAPVFTFPASQKQDLRHNDPVDGDNNGKYRVDPSLVIDWDGRASGKTAIDHFKSTFGHKPLDERPSADQILHANRKYYNALAQYQKRLGLSIGDLFPIDFSAKGGGREKLARSRNQSDEEAKATLLARREADRRRQAARRARIKEVRIKPS